jgi:cellulose synthase/poly-beta-1,6-N-acetylglucosamine synthase-like glycosyltransferase
MKLVFWLSSFLILLTYFGYPACLYVRARYWPRPVRRADIAPTITIVMAVHNEERSLPDKLCNLAELNYPEDKLDVIVVSDGSTDKTNNILAAWEDLNQRIVILPNHQGKARALNHAVAEAQGEIVVFTDARQVIAVHALRNLVADFADPSVGCVSGELILVSDVPSSCAGVGLYWRVEKNIRKWEAIAGSTVGATGAFYGVRRELLSTLPGDTILDDVYIPLQVAKKGLRVIFEPQAQAWDHLTPGPRQEFRRKVRTLTGNYQLLQLAPWLLTHSNPLRFQFICHKLLRLLVPFALAGTLVSAFWLRRDGYELVLVAQLCFYALAIVGVFHTKVDLVSRLSNVSLTFLLMNAAAAVALIYFVTGRKAVWVR